jgi:DnaK suppressor protein
MSQRPPPRRDEWDEADARGEAAPKPVFLAPSQPGGEWTTLVLGADQLATARTTLDNRIAQLASDLATIEKQEDRRDGSRPQYGKRIGDHTSDALETRRNAAASDTLRLQLAEARRAVAKLDEGSYGRCDGCGGPIGAERLDAMPWAAECVECRRAHTGLGREIRHRWP